MKSNIIHRAWDNVEKRMHFPEESCISLDAEGLIYFEGQFTPEIQERFEILQYIGINDKTEKRIYVGDILYVAGVGNCKVVFADAAFGLTNDDKTFYFFNEDYENDISLLVLGNIYQNPKLLELREDEI